MMPESERSRSILYLHEIERSLVQADIELYLRDELESIALTDDDITELAEHAGNLFIYAATAVRYIRPVGIAVNSKARLKAILAISAESQKKLSAIDTLYTAILTAAIDHLELEPEERSQRRLVIWTAVCACEPIPIETLSVLSGLDNKDDAMAALQPLRSVLHVSDRSELVTTLHASFPDYMFSQDRSGVFHCDKSAHSQLLAEQCFKIMKSQLRFNICSIQSSFIPNEQIPELEERIIAGISEELLYSCRFWVDHLSETNSSDTPLLWVHDFLCHRLLFWMEVMSLKNCMATGTMTMIKLNTWLSQVIQHLGRSTDLFDLASDAQAFVAKYSLSPASAYTPHIYLSALPLSPPSSLVRIQYLPHFKGLIKVSGTIIDNMEKAAIGTWTFASSIRSATFSPSGDLIILGDEKGRISVHNAYGGKSLVQPFKAHRKLVASLTVSSDGMQILSGSHDKTLSIWNMHDGSLISGPYKGHRKRVTSVAFSSDAAYIASGSDDCRIRIWNPRNANDVNIVGLLTGHAKEVKSVAFSPNGSRVISGSTDQTIRVWDLSSESTVLVLHGHTGGVSSIQFSPDGTHIISGSYDTTVRIWNASDGSLSRILEGHSKRITSTSPNGDLVVSGSLDCTIRVWNMHTGELVVDPFEGHSDSVRCVGISGDGIRVMSASDDKTVRVWNVQRRTPQNEKTAKRGSGSTSTFTSSPTQPHFTTCDSTEPNVHVWDLRTITHVVIPTGAEIRCLQLSLDGTRIHTLHAPGTLCTWDAQTAELLDGPYHCSVLEWWNSAACSVDGTRVVLCHANKVTLWHVRQQSNQSTVVCETGRHFGRLRATFSQDGSKFILSGLSGLSGLSPNYVTEILDADTGAHVAGPFNGEIIALSSDGMCLCLNRGDVHCLIDANARVYTFERSNPLFTPDGFQLSDPRYYDTWGGLGHIPSQISVKSGSKHFKIFGRPLHGWLLASYPVQEGRHVCRFHIDHPPFVISPDGWILDGQDQRLFWVPPEIRKDFPGCNGVIIDSSEVLQCVDYGDMLVGDNWSQCYMPTTHPM
ncbi:unnamed protein product [Rhizoctonia solani]|nr:unnamed protein product [Rhizoctonia solani]